ncbi:HAMP domain-containing sensor histidine kinase [Paenibacillus sp. L3-i20]|uniref:sensor histidine kinase n=1 Tax=Paenibacillus sp. L3-i20 TaxID=2905833 RepID=UPI001EDF6B09|nr:HAMP domain-containing sensor histidine kinase [Paenibacillus sp. L3-i20]GKU79413.1 hypothetical protein L3i20_v238100 [Paenibacillus sp. L3-i20]
MIKSLYIRVIGTFLVVIMISLLSSFYIGRSLFKKEISRIGQNDMIAVGEEIIAQYEQTKPDDRDEFIQRMVKVSAHPIHLYKNSDEVKFYNLKNTTKIKISNESIINRLMLLVLLVGIVIGCVCIVVAARYLVKPLQILTQATKRLAKGDFDVEIKTKSTDEIGVLTQGFNEMASELKQLEKMRQDFVTNVSHEIQTPLTSISGFAMALKNRQLVAEANRNHYLDIIIAESSRLSRLSDNLLELASLDSEQHPFEPAKYNLSEQIRGIVVTCEPQWSAKEQKIDLHIDNSVTILADQDQLNQVWMNLLGNSIKFTPPNGHIEISLTQSGNEIIIAITDSGIGIAPEQIDFVFDRFYKTDPSRNRNISGNGLGLAIVKKIITLHQGIIEIKSQTD